MTVVKRAAFPAGGVVMTPPLQKSEAEAIFGEDLADAWDGIRRAFMSFGMREDAFACSKTSRKKDDPQSWHVRQAETAKALQAAMQKLDKVQSSNGDFLIEASENYSLQTFGRSRLSEANAVTLLEDAYATILRASAIIERAEPFDFETTTPAASRRLLVRDLRDALDTAGIKAEVSDGRGIPCDASEYDLTPFEQFVSALGVHEAETPNALSRWVRRSLAGQE